MINVCQERVKEKLKFSGYQILPLNRVLGPTTSYSALLIYGSVEAQNGFGGYGTLSYMCSFEKFGKQYVPKDVMVH